VIRLDLKKDEKLEGIQIDNYEINASVTDINGETQSANTDLKVASVSHYIKADEIKNIFSDENVKLKVETKNYNEQVLKKHIRLNYPSWLLRTGFSEIILNRKFRIFQIFKEEFISKFPHDFLIKMMRLKTGKQKSCC
jgi:predicted alternative tryptophan synthase beta-subunit